MTITEIIDKLRQERELGSRFPARIIFCEDLSSYSALVKQLKSACDVTINLADFGKKDVVPRFEKIRDAITQYDDKQVLLLSVGEYLRICIKRELNKERAQFPSFWEAMQQEASRTRIIMPVCRDSFDRIVGKVDERQEAFMWKLDQGNNQTPKQYSISVYSPQFAEAISADADDFESWLRNWDGILRRDVPCTIITNQYKYTEASFGAIKLNPIDSPFAYVCDSIKDSDKLNKSWESDDFWAKLIPSLEKDMLFSELVLKELSITTLLQLLRMYSVILMPADLMSTRT